MAKLFVSDIDGTLLTNDHKMTERTKEALKKLVDHGYDIALCSGRVLESVKANGRLTGLETFSIGNNGAIISNSKEIIYKNPIDLSIVEKIIELAEKKGYGFHMYDEKTYYSNVFHKDMLRHLKLDDPINKQAEVYCRPNVIEHILDHKINIYKVMLHMDFADDLDTYETIKGFGDLYLSMSGPRSADIMNYGVSKGNAIEILEKVLDKKYEKIVAIGDHENDIPMIDYAHIGIAMGNGIDQLKEKADYITDTNQNDGLAKAVDYVLESDKN